MPDSISEHLFLQFHQCGFLLHRRRSRFHGKGSMVRHAQGRLLVLLNRMEGASQKELADILGIRPPSLSELVVKLERTGHITRQTNAKDKRLMDIAITPLGREFVREAEQERSTAASVFFAGLSEEEQEQLSSLLGKLIAALEEEDLPLEEADPEAFPAHACGQRAHQHGRCGFNKERHGHALHGHGPRGRHLERPGHDPERRKHGRERCGHTRGNDRPEDRADSSREMYEETTE